MSTLASHHLAIVLTVTLAVILLTISAAVALLCLLRLRRLHRRRRHDEVKYVDGVAASVYGCSRDLSCFRFHDGDAAGRTAATDATELKKLPVNVDGDVACKDCQVRSIFAMMDILKIVYRPHRTTTNVDSAYCYRPSSVVCWSVGLSVTIVSLVKTAEPIDMPFGL